MNLRAHHPQAVNRENDLQSLTTRTVSPSAHPRPASVAAADFFLASALHHHETLRPRGAEDARCVRPISATQTRYVHSHRVCSRLALATSAAGTPHGVLGSVRHDRGDRTFHDVRARFGGSPATRFPMMSTSRPPSRAWAFSSHGADCDRASDTPVALPRSPSRLPCFRAGCHFTVPLAFGLGTRVGGCGGAPRSPVDVSRDRERFDDDPGCLQSTGSPSWDPVAVTAPVPRPLHRF